MAGNKTLNGLRMKHLQGRKLERGYTMDSGNTKRRDDGFFVEKHDDGSWTVKISIADVAAFLPIGCPMNKTAMQQLECTWKIPLVLDSLPLRPSW